MLPRDAAVDGDTGRSLGNLWERWRNGFGEVFGDWVISGLQR